MVSPRNPHPSDSSSFDLAYEQAGTFHRNGDLHEAERGYRTLLEANPQHAELNHSLGTLLLEAARVQEALPLLRTALQVNPKAGQHWLSYVGALIDDGQRGAARAMLAQGQRYGLRGEGLQSLLPRLQPAGAADANRDDLDVLFNLFSQSRFAEMEQAALRLTSHSPALGSGWKALGTAIVMQGRPAEALAPLEKAAALLPDDVETQINYGNLLHELGHLAEAEKCYRRLIDSDPRNAEAHRLLGLTLRDGGELALSEASGRRALELKPDSAEALSNLGSILLAQGRVDEAEQCYRQTLKMRPLLAEAHYDLATMLNGQFRFAEAEAGFRRALDMKPDYVPALNNLGIALNATGQHVEAEAELQRALELSPGRTDVRCNLSVALGGQGRLEEADVCLQAAIGADPLNAKARSMRLFNLNYTARHSADYRVEQARQFGAAVHSPHSAAYSSWACSTAPTVLRVGLVSGDLYNHPVGYFLESWVAHVDAARVELYAYPTAHQQDELTARIRPRFAAWHPIAGISDESAARRIHADGIHLLIDLSGHTAGNRLPVFARKPAPVQVSWLGYFATTGVGEMDYLIADPTSVHATEFDQFTEAICYLPETRLCFTPSPASPPVASLPAARNGYITFGCFQKIAKIGDDVLALWAKILAALPNARLRMQCREIGYEASRELLRKRMRACGIGDDRASLHGRAERHAYLAAYHAVDIVLDTFPYPGGTTTCEALWMGVPTLTLVGDSLLGRQGASLLTAAGLPNWIATDEADYLAQAVSRAGDPASLSALRAGLRAGVKDSPLFDAQRFARQFEEALWRMWRARQQNQ